MGHGMQGNALCVCVTSPCVCAGFYGRPWSHEQRCDLFTQ